MLATSRVRLGLPGEKVVRLAGLGPEDQVELFWRAELRLKNGTVVPTTIVSAKGGNVVVDAAGRPADEIAEARFYLK